MTSWLSGGLSQFSSLTDQISSFTKDVINETTEEIEDPTAELQVARKKIEHLEEVNNHYKTEWEKLQKHSEEVRERAETAECQIAAISQEYRKLIGDRDAELRRLRTETESLREQQRKMVVSGPRGQSSAQSPLKELAQERGFFAEKKGEKKEESEWEVACLEPVVMVGGGGEEEVVVRGEEGGGGGGWSEYHDFGDVISSQGEINRLQIELTKLRSENRHWRALAEEKGHSTESYTSGPMESELSTLRDQIEELQLCLQRERTQHQHQMSALEAAHHDKLHNMATRNDILEGHSFQTKEGGEGGEGRGVSEQLKEAMGEEGKEERSHETGNTGSTNETIRGSLLPALEEVSLDEVDSGDTHRRNEEQTAIANLQFELASSHQKCVQLKLELEKRTREVEELDQWKKDEKEEREKEKELLELHRAEVTSLSSQLTLLQEERSGVESKLLQEIDRVRSEMKKLEMENEELKTAQETLVILQTEMNQTLAVNKELKVREHSIVKEKTEAEEKLKELTGSFNSQTEVVAELQRELERLKQHFQRERETYTRHMEQEKTQLSSLVEHLQTNVSRHEESIESLQGECDRSQRDAEALSQQVAQLVADVEGKDQQLQLLSQSKSEEKSAIIRERLQESNARISDLEEKLRITEAACEEKLKRVNTENEECLRRVNSEMEEHIKRVNSEKELVSSQLRAVLDENIELQEKVMRMTEKAELLHEQVIELRGGDIVERGILPKEILQQKSLTEGPSIDGERIRLERLLTERNSRVKDLETEVGDMRVRFAKMSNDYTKLEERLKEKETVIEHSERNLREVGLLLASREQEITSLQRQGHGELETRGAGEEGKNSEHEGQDTIRALEMVTGERDQLLQTMKTRESEILSLQSRLVESQEVLDRLSNQIQQLNTRNSELEQLITSAKTDTQTLVSERDRLKEEMAEKEKEEEKVRGELAGKISECSKLNRQLEHLKAHLVQVEEQYTHDALRAEEREREERQRAAQLQESLRNSTLIDQQESLQAKAQLAALEEQLHVMAGQRDAAILELSSARDEAEGNASALHNLQTVLEQFQRERSSELNEALKKAQVELADSLSQLESLRTAHRELQRELKEARATEELLDQQLQEKERKVGDLQREVDGASGRLKSTEQALEKVMREQGGRVDQNLVKNLVVGYVQASDRKKPEVLNLIAKILDFSPSQIQQVQPRRGGWLGGLWRRQDTLSPSSTSPKLPVQGGSLSQLFVSFLESESLPNMEPLSMTHHPPVLPTLDPPPSGRRPDPDPDRPSHSTTGLTSFHSSTRQPQVPRPVHPPLSSLHHQSSDLRTPMNPLPPHPPSAPTSVDTNRHTGSGVSTPSLKPLNATDTSSISQSPSSFSSDSTRQPLLVPALQLPSSNPPPPSPQPPHGVSSSNYQAPRHTTTTPHQQPSILKHLLSPHPH